MLRKLSKLSAQTGYLMIDHRNSPGIPGLVSGGSLFEADTYTCSHCQAIIVKNPLRTRGRHFCAKCNSYVCDNPACGLECNPFKKRLDELHHQAQVGSALPAIP